MSDRPKSGLVVYAKDVASVSEFYAAVLGVDDLGREDGFAVVETPDCQLVVVAIPAAVAHDIVIATPPVRRTENPLKFSFPVDSIALARATAERHGGQIDAPEQEWQFRTTGCATAKIQRATSCKFGNACVEPGLRPGPARLET